MKMKYAFTRNKTMTGCECFCIFTEKKQNTFTAVFKYKDNRSNDVMSYQSETFTSQNEWAVIKVALIYAESIFQDFQIKNYKELISKVWDKFFYSKQPELFK